MNKAVWINGKYQRTGCWIYYWPSDTFILWLDKTVGFNGEQLKRLVLKGYDSPEWGKWKLVK